MNKYNEQADRLKKKLTKNTEKHEDSISLSKMLRNYKKKNKEKIKKLYFKFNDV